MHGSINIKVSFNISLTKKLTSAVLEDKQDAHLFFINLSQLITYVVTIQGSEHVKFIRASVTQKI